MIQKEITERLNLLYQKLKSINEKDYLDCPNFPNSATCIIIGEELLQICFQRNQENNYENNQFDHDYFFQFENLYNVKIYFWVINLQNLMNNHELDIQNSSTIMRKLTVELLTSDERPLRKKDSEQETHFSLKDENSKIQITNSRINPFMITIYSESQILLGNIQDALENGNTSTSMFRLNISKNISDHYKINAIKFHKFSPHHLAILTNYNIFTIFNLKDDLKSPEITVNLSQVQIIGSNCENINYVSTTQKTQRFIDFEFGGNDCQFKDNLSQKIDFDFLAIYFLTTSGSIFYQSPFLLKELTIDRNYIKRLQFVVSEKIKQYNAQKTQPIKEQMLHECQIIIDMIINGDLFQFEDSTRKISNMEIFKTANNFSSQISLINTSTLGQLKEKVHKFKFILKKIRIQSINQSSLFNRKKQFKLKDLQRNFRAIHKIELGSFTHSFILSKEIGNKPYSTISTYFSPQFLFPSHQVGQYELLKGEKAHLECPIQQNYCFGNPSIIKFKESSYARLIADRIYIHELDKVAFQVMNRIFSISFISLQNQMKSKTRQQNESNQALYSEMNKIIDSHIIQNEEIENILIKAIQIQSVTIKNNCLFIQSQQFEPIWISLEHQGNYQHLKNNQLIRNEEFQYRILELMPQRMETKINDFKTSQKVLSSNLQSLQFENIHEIKLFEDSFVNYVKEHERIIKDNTQIISQKNEIMLKKITLLENNRYQCEKKAINQISNLKYQVQPLQERIDQKNISIKNKQIDIANILQQLKAIYRNDISQHIIDDKDLNSICSDLFSKLKDIQNQFQQYCFEKNILLEYFSVKSSAKDLQKMNLLLFKLQQSLVKIRIRVNSEYLYQQKN